MNDLGPSYQALVYYRRAFRGAALFCRFEAAFFKKPSSFSKENNHDHVAQWQRIRLFTGETERSIPLMVTYFCSPTKFLGT